jgi:hypothetical protein
MYQVVSAKLWYPAPPGGRKEEGRGGRKKAGRQEKLDKHLNFQMQENSIKSECYIKTNNIVRGLEMSCIAFNLTFLKRIVGIFKFIDKKILIFFFQIKETCI